MIESQCKYNKMIDCSSRTCAGCGWHPEVCARRLKAIRDKFRDRFVYTNT